jgi:hypothetical protein
MIFNHLDPLPSEDYLSRYEIFEDYGSCSHPQDSCTSYGGNARDSLGRVPTDANGATDCCSFCCNRTDPYPITTTTTTTTTTATSGSREVVLNKPLYLSGLTMLVLVTLKINKIQLLCEC